MLRYLKITFQFRDGGPSVTGMFEADDVLFQNLMTRRLKNTLVDIIENVPSLGVPYTHIFKEGEK